MLELSWGVRRSHEESASAASEASKQRTSTPKRATASSLLEARTSDLSNEATSKPHSSLSDISNVFHELVDEHGDIMDVSFNLIRSFGDYSALDITDTENSDGNNDESLNVVDTTKSPRAYSTGEAVQEKELIRDHGNVREMHNDREEVSASTPEVETASGKLPPNTPMQEVDDEVDPKDADGGARIDQNLTACDDTEAAEEDIGNQMETLHIAQRIEGEGGIGLETPRSEKNAESTSVTAKYSAKENVAIRQAGQSYIGRQYINGGKEFELVNIQPRQIGARCSFKYEAFKCQTITQEEREAQFKTFWAMSWEAKEVFVKAMVERQNPNKACKQRQRLVYFMKHEDQRHRVCKEMFLNTLDLKEWTVWNWVLNKKGESQLRPPKSSHYDRAAVQRANCSAFLDNVPTLPSHYCRKTSSKNYVERRFRSINEVRRAYANVCNEKGEAVLSRTAFSRLFHQKNMAIFAPRKDQCYQCVKFEQGNLPTEDWEFHRNKKDQAQQAKAVDKDLAMHENVLVTTMDLQAVLLSPSSKAAALYYKTKLCCHNFTVYELASHKVQNYFWHEADGGLTAYLFASCVHHYLIARLQYDKYILYSDGCTYQTRNAILSKALQKFAVDHQKIVVQKFLEKGHTYMECDSVHSAIERAISGADIFVPSDYVRKIKSARVKGEPYDVEYVDYTFFKEFSKVSNLTTIRPGKKPGDSQVVDIRCLQYLPDGTIKYKLEHGDEEWRDLPHKRGENNGQYLEPTRLYKEKRKISGEKFSHLQQLKAIMPKDYHSFYDQLLY